jgi:hypothetical protein
MWPAPVVAPLRSGGFQLAPAAPVGGDCRDGSRDGLSSCSESASTGASK